MDTPLLRQLAAELAAVLAPVVTPPVVTPPVVTPPVVTPPVVSSGSVLRSSKLKYKGVFTLPYIDAWSRGTQSFGFASGAFTMRRVNGERRFLMTGGKNEGFPLFEFSYPGVGPTIEAAPRATAIRNWGPIGPIPLAAGNQNVGLRALIWANGQLYYGYGDEYNAAGTNNPCVGAVALNDADGTKHNFGPWRTAEHCQKTRGYFVPIPPAFQQAHGVGPIGFGCPNTAGNASSPWGVELVAGAMPSNSTPADAVTDPAQIAITNMRRLIHHDIAHPQRRNANYKTCGYTVKYDASKGGTVQPGVPSWIDLDEVTAAVWVDLPDVQGFVAFGLTVDAIPGFTYADGDTVPHQWYGPPTCVHGQNGGGVSISIGPAAGSMIPRLWFYDPADLAKVATGTLNPNAIQPVEEVQLTTIGSPIPLRGFTAYELAAAHFDAETRSIFLSVPESEHPNPYSPSPVIYEFTIL